MAVVAARAAAGAAVGAAAEAAGAVAALGIPSGSQGLPPPSSKIGQCPEIMYELRCMER
jgi:hypothetical protein